MATSGFLFDQRLMKIRRKTIMELNPTLLWDAAHGITVADGEKVASWVDRITGLDAVQATADNQPTYLTNGIGGQPALSFAGSQWLLCAATAVASATEGTIIIGFEHATPGTEQALFCGYDGAAANENMQCIITAGGKLAFVHQQATPTGVVTGGTTVGTSRRLASFTHNAAGDAWVLYLDRTSETLTATGGGNLGTWFAGITTIQYLCIGSKRGNATGGFKGKISYIAVWNYIL